MSALVLGPPAAFATEVEFVGRMGSRVVLQVDGGPLRTVAAGGETPEGVRVLAIEHDQVLVETAGRRLRVRMGEGAIRVGTPAGPANLVLHADSRGHFVSEGTINGASVRFLVDTGASVVSLGKGDAQRAGIDYRRGMPSTSLTAAGPTQVWRVRIDTLRIGSMTLHNVDAAVHEQDLPIVLLGMSVLNRMEMKRDGTTLMLQQRY